MFPRDAASATSRGNNLGVVRSLLLQILLAVLDVYLSGFCTCHFLALQIVDGIWFLFIEG